MLATNYSYTIDEAGDVITIVLSEHLTGKTKTFVQHCKSLKGQTSAMESLTDECCAGFFPEERKPKEKKPK